MIIRIRDTGNAQHIIDFGPGTDIIRMPQHQGEDVYSVLLPGGFTIPITQGTYDVVVGALDDLIDLDLIALAEKRKQEQDEADAKESERLEQQRILEDAERIKAGQEAQAETERLAELGRASEASAESESEEEEVDESEGYAPAGIESSEAPGNDEPAGGEGNASTPDDSPEAHGINPDEEAARTQAQTDALNEDEADKEGTVE